MNAGTFSADLTLALGDQNGSFTSADKSSAIRRALAQHAIYRPRRTEVVVSLVSGTTNYELPDGFLGPDSESLARALGGPGSVRRRGGFRDGAWIVSRAYSGTGYGLRAGFGGTVPYGFFGNLGLQPCAVGLETVLRFEEGDPPTLRIDPAPTADGELKFDGFFPPTIETCPETDREPLLCLCRAFCMEGKARSLGALGKYTEGDVSRDRSAAAKSLTDLAAVAREEYKDLIRMRPMVVTG